MSKVEILDELPRLKPEEREEIRLKLAELDGNDWLDEDDPLTESEKALIEQRVADLERNPRASIPWAEARAHLQARFVE